MPKHKPAAGRIGNRSRARRSQQAPEGPLDRQLQAQLSRAFSGDTWEARDPQAFVDILYARDAFATSEGSPQSWSGNDQLVALVTDVMERFRTISFQRIRTSRLGIGGASQLMIAKAAPRASRSRVQTFKVLFTWRRTRHGWRVVHDFTARGGIDESSAAHTQGG